MLAKMISITKQTASYRFTSLLRSRLVPYMALFYYYNMPLPYKRGENLVYTTELSFLLHGGDNSKQYVNNIHHCKEAVQFIHLCSDKITIYV